MTVQVGLVQINNSFSGQNYFPYSAGLLEAYAKRHLKCPERYRFVTPLYKRVPIAEGVQKLKNCDVIAFSTYVWNVRISLEMARRIKLENPDSLIIFGGPQVPDKAEFFLREHPFIDLCCHGEGEDVFRSILESYDSRAWDELQSISYITKEGQFVDRPKSDRIKDPTSIPSPYLEGIFEPLMRENPNEQWLVLWETNRGCPFSCTFCDWGSATQSKVFSFDLERLYQEIAWMANHQIEFVFCCDANFGILKRDLEIAQRVAEVKTQYGYPRALSVQNTKNATERAYAVQKLLSDFGLNKGVTLALQSMDVGTLKSIKRQNISTESYQELQRRFTRDKVETYTDMILGLPGETYNSFADGVSRLIQNGQHNRIQFNNLTILPNAEMGDPEYQHQYGMVTVQTKIINIHGALDESQEEVDEIQDLVIATSSMPKLEWVRTRAFSWMAALLHFDKILQIPLVMIHEMGALSYRELIELFLEGDLESYPVLSETRTLFVEKAQEMQQGGPEYSRGDQWLQIWWPTDEYVFIKLYVEHKLEKFYDEAEKLLERQLTERSIDIPQNLLHESFELNRRLLKLPFVSEDLDLQLSYNIWEFYKGILQGEAIPLTLKSTLYHIDRSSESWNSVLDWCKHVVWYGNKKGAYLYGNRTIEPEIAGHY